MTKKINIHIPGRGQFMSNCTGKVPDKGRSIYLLKDLIEFLFPILSKKDINQPDRHIQIIFSKLLEILDRYETRLASNENTAEAFCHALPSVYKKLVSDAEAICAGDPAAKSIDEVVITYPGFYAILVHRLAHELYQLSVPVIPRLWTEYSHGKTGIDIHPGANIGPSFCIDHGTGVVIGESTKIGSHVKIYQGVTLGALSVSKEKAGTKRHPTIEDHVTIYAGSTILGGQTIVGAGSVIGGNVWLTHSVPPDSLVLNQHKIKHLDKNTDYSEGIDYVI